MSRAARRGGVGILVAAGLAALLGAPLPAAAQGVGGQACPSLPPRNPMPPDAQPSYLENPAWRGIVTQLSQRAAPLYDKAQLVFLGDSITQAWYLPVWQQFYDHRWALNLGVSGDFTQGLLWRLREGGQWPASLRPRLAVVLIGTNNAGFARSPEDTALGIAEVVRTIRQRSPATRILLVGLLPRGAEANDPLRAVNQRVNELVSRCADNQTIFFTDPGSFLVDGYGRLSDQVSYDRLHLTGVGYAILSTALEPAIRGLLGR